MKIDEFNFELPEELIAKYPVEPRDSSNLAAFNEQGRAEKHKFFKIIDLLASGDVLVFNNSKVIPAYFEIEINNKKVSFNIVNISLSENNKQKFDILAKPAKHLKDSSIIEFSNDFKFFIRSKDIETGTIKVECNCNKQEFLEQLEKYGKPPLPPYIIKKRKIIEEDKASYQTIYAKKAGSVAAPTAGLHFTDEVLNRLRQKNVKIVELTLHVGGGTFLPVKVEDLQEHKMHSEILDVSRETSVVINNAKRAGKRIISVGTTTLRALESSIDEKGYLVPQVKNTDIFIYPGYEFKITDCLITNFHLPKSTLFILISALIGINKAKELYNFAIENKMRFFSYGDACFLQKS